MFWADLGEKISISRANMDGSYASKIITSRMKWPCSLTIDHINERLYWADYVLQQIELCDFHGKGRQSFETSLNGPTSLTLSSIFVYWSEWQSKTLNKRAKKRNGHVATVMKDLKAVTGIKAVNLEHVPGLTFCACNMKNKILYVPALYTPSFLCAFNYQLIT